MSIKSGFNSTRVVWKNSVFQCTSGLPAMVLHPLLVGFFKMRGLNRFYGPLGTKEQGSGEPETPPLRVTTLVCSEPGGEWV